MLFREHFGERKAFAKERRNCKTRNLGRTRSSPQAKPKRITPLVPQLRVLLELFSLVPVVSLFVICEQALGELSKTDLERLEFVVSKILGSEIKVLQEREEMVRHRLDRTSCGRESRQSGLVAEDGQDLQRAKRRDQQRQVSLKGLYASPCGTLHRS